MNNVDGVIAALRVLVKENRGGWRKSKELNRLIAQLPGSRFGRLRHLRISGDIDGEMPNELFMSHAKATLAFLEANRDAIAAMRSWSLWPKAAVKPQSQQEPATPIDAEFKEVTSETGRLQKPKKGVRLIK